MWPWKVARIWAISASQSGAVWSSDAVSTGRPSGLKTAPVWPVEMWSADSGLLD
jgi:hypothetical protein